MDTLADPSAPHGAPASPAAPTAACCPLCGDVAATAEALARHLAGAHDLVDEAGGDVERTLERWRTEPEPSPPAPAPTRPLGQPRSDAVVRRGVVVPPPAPLWQRALAATGVSLALVAVVLAGAWVGLAVTAGERPVEAAVAGAPLSGVPAAPPAPAADVTTDDGVVVEALTVDHDAAADFAGTAVVRNRSGLPVTGDVVITLYAGGRPVGALQGSVVDLADSSATAVALWSTDDYVAGVDRWVLTASVS